MDASKAKALSDRGDFHQTAFDQHGHLTDLNNAIEYYMQAASSFPEQHPDKATTLDSLGNAYENRFERLDDLCDIDRAIHYHNQAVCLTPQGHSAQAEFLNNLGLSYHSRFERLGDPKDLDMSIEHHNQAVHLTTEKHTDKAKWLTNLGNAYVSGFESGRGLQALETAISYHDQAVSLTPDGDPDKAVYLNNLGNAHESRFEHLGDVVDLDKAIICLNQAVALTPEGCPKMAGRLNNLGISLHSRFERLDGLPDLEKAIDCQTQAVSLSHEEELDKAAYLCNLGLSYRTRFERLGNLEDLDSALECHSQALHLTPERHADKPERFDSLGTTHRIRFEHLGEVSDLDEAINYHGQAVSLIGQNHPSRAGFLDNLGLSHSARFCRLSQLADIDSAIDFQNQAIKLTPEEELDKAKLINNLGVSYQKRFELLGNLEDLDSAIAKHQQAVSLTPSEHPDTVGWLQNLADSYESRFERTGNLLDLDAVIESRSIVVSLTPEGHTERAGRLSSLGSSYCSRFKHLENPPDIDTAINLQSQAMVLTPDQHAKRPRRLDDIGISHRIRFECLGDRSDIEKAIGFQVQAVLFTPEGHSDKAERLNNLSISYQRLFFLLNDPIYINRSVECLQTAAQLPAACPTTRFLASRGWAHLSLAYDISSPFAAYHQLLALIPRLVWLGNSTNRRYEEIKTIGDALNEAALVAILLQDFNSAIEWLEEGRSIVWRQRMQLRTSLETLANENAVLAERFRQVARGLEELEAADPTNSVTLSDAYSSEQTTQHHHRLAEKWDQLLDEARLAPNFQNFLRPKKLQRLLVSAKSGPVVMISDSEVVCGALILIPNKSAASYVHLPTFSYNKSLELCNYIKTTLHYGDITQRFQRRPVYMNQPQTDQFEVILSVLWIDVVKPVLEYLGFLQLREEGQDLPHITWCASGPLAFLPIHAAGCYNEPKERIFDYVISSYTPSLGALIDAYECPTQFRGMLAIGQTHTKGQSRLPGTAVELEAIRKQFGNSRFTQLDGEHATVSNTLDALQDHSWVHFACHASQNRQDPTRSAFHLHDGTLDLATITKSSIKHGGLAFLSGCETAMGEESLPTESVHLAAGMLMTGFSSVIATMWSIEDRDAPLIADKVYERLLEGGNPDSSRAARALHEAVKYLREKAGEKEFKRWVPYIHMGI